jgi:polar amino acid transport system permease protein
LDFNVEIVKNALPLLLAGPASRLRLVPSASGWAWLSAVWFLSSGLTQFRLLRYLGNVYVDFIRGTPLLVQIFLVYFALPAIIGQRVDAFLQLFPPALSTAVRMWRRFSAVVSSLSIRDRWKPDVVWV